MFLKCSCFFDIVNFTPHSTKFSWTQLHNVTACVLHCALQNTNDSDIIIIGYV